MIYKGVDKIGTIINNWLVLEIGPKLGKFQCLKCSQIYNREKKSILNGKSLGCLDCCYNRKYQDLTGHIINNWEIIKLNKITHECQSGRYWEIKCDKCNRIKQVSELYLIKQQLPCLTCYPRPRIIKQPIDLTGKIFNNWKVLKAGPRNNRNMQTWLCECLLCNQQKILAASNVKKSKQCRSCTYQTNINNKSGTWIGFGDISGSQWRNIIRSAKNRNIFFDLTIEYCWNLFLEQDKKCALSGTQIVFAINKRSRKETTASLDRIDSSKGYIEGNVQWLHKDINRMKWTNSDDEFIKWCKKVVLWQKNQQKKIAINQSFPQEVG